MPLTIRTTQVMKSVISDPQTSVEILAFFNNPASLGIVTSVGFAAPAQFTVSGSPVTGASTITMGWANQAMNTVLSGPANGADASPTFRALVVQDIPTLPYSKITNLSNDLATKAPIDSPVFQNSVTFAEGLNVHLGSGVGTIIGSTTSEKLGFYGTTSRIQPSGDILTALGTTSGLGLIASPTISESDVTNLVSDLAAKSPINSPTFTGTPAAPAPAAGTNTTQIATTGFVVAATAYDIATATYMGGL